MIAPIWSMRFEVPQYPGEANFTITSLPARGSFYLAAVGAGLVLILLLNLRRQPAPITAG